MHTQDAEVGVRVPFAGCHVIHEEIAALESTFIFILISLIPYTVMLNVQLFPCEVIVIAVVVIAQIDTYAFISGLGAGPVYGINDNGSGALGFEPRAARIVESHIRISLVRDDQAVNLATRSPPVLEEVERLAEVLLFRTTSKG